MKKNIVEKLVSLQTHRFLYPMCHVLLSFLAVEIPYTVVFGKGVRFAHRAPGCVLHPQTRIGDNVHIYQGVTLGLAKPWESVRGGGYIIDVQSNVILCAGAKILSKGNLVIGKGTIVAANAVLTCSTGEDEIWAGIPARRVGFTKP